MIDACPNRATTLCSVRLWDGRVEEQSRCDAHYETDALKDYGDAALPASLNRQCGHEMVERGYPVPRDEAGRPLG